MCEQLFLDLATDKPPRKKKAKPFLKQNVYGVKTLGINIPLRYR